MVRKLVKELNIPESTVRKILKELEKEGKNFHLEFH